MQRLDALPWKAGLSLVSHGVTVGIRTNEPGILSDVEALLPRGWTRSDQDEVGRLLSLHVAPRKHADWLTPLHVLYANTVRRIRSESLDEVLHRLESELHLYVGEKTDEAIFVHAGVVGWKDRAILIPGRTFTGKTTLVAELLEAGATYYSDEFAVIDSDGRVHPYTTPLSLRGDGAGPGRPTPPESLGASVGETPLEPALVVLTEYTPRGQWSPVRLSAGQAVLGMLENTVPARRRPRESLRALRRVAESAVTLKGERGEAWKVVPDLLRAVERTSEPSTTTTGSNASSDCGCGAPSTSTEVSSGEKEVASRHAAAEVDG